MGDGGTALLVVIIASIATLAASAITKLGDAWIKHREREAARDEERLIIGDEIRQIAQYGTHLQYTDLEDAARMLQENGGRLRQRARWLYGRRAAELIIRIHAWINTARNWHAGAQKRNEDEHWKKSPSAIQHLWKPAGCVGYELLEIVDRRETKPVFKSAACARLAWWIQRRGWRGRFKEPTHAAEEFKKSFIRDLYKD